MLAIAQALMAEPKMLMLDEPSFGLAPKIVDEVFETIQKINETGFHFPGGTGCQQVAQRGSSRICVGEWSGHHAGKGKNCWEMIISNRRISVCRDKDKGEGL